MKSKSIKNLIDFGFIIMIVAFSTIMNYYDSMYWLLAFLTVAICRFEVNRNKTLFIWSVVVAYGPSLLSYIPVLYNSNLRTVNLLVFPTMVGLQALFGVISIIINLKNRAYNQSKVFIFFYSEVVMVIFLIYYLVFSIYESTMLLLLYNWCWALLIIQILFLIFVSYRPRFDVVYAGMPEIGDIIVEEVRLLLKGIRASFYSSFNGQRKREMREYTKDLEKHQDNKNTYLNNNKGEFSTRTHKDKSSSGDGR